MARTVNSIFTVLLLPFERAVGPVGKSSDSEMRWFKKLERFETRFFRCDFISSADEIRY